MKDEYLELLSLIEEGCSVLRPMLSELIDTGVALDESDLCAARDFREHLMVVAETLKSGTEAA